MELDIGKNSLILSTNRIPKEEAIELDITKIHKTGVNWLLAAAYKRGYDKIIVKYKNESQLKEISMRIKECLKNYEIIEPSNSTITIKAISNSQNEDFNVLLRQIFLVNLSFFKSVQEALQNKKYGALLDSVYLEETNDSLVNTCQRMIIKNKNISHKDASFFYVIIWQLEKTADSLKHFCQDINDRKSINSELSGQFDEIVELYENFYNIYYNFDLEKLDELIKKKKGLLSKFKNKEDFYLRQLSEQIFDLSGSFFALNI